MKLSVICFLVVSFAIIPAVYSADSCYCLYDCDNYAQCDFYAEQPDSHHELCPDSSCDSDGNSNPVSCDDNSDCIPEETDDGIDYTVSGTCTEYTCTDNECVVKYVRDDSCAGAGLWEWYAEGTSCKSIYRSCPNECWKREYDQGTCYEGDGESYCFCYNNGWSSTPTGYSDDMNSYSNQRDIEMTEGWNLISNPFSGTYGIDSNCEIIASIYGYDGGLKPISDPLNGMKGGKAYLIKVSGDCTISLGGNTLITGIQLGSGWNMVGTTGNDEMTVSKFESDCDLSSSIYYYNTGTGYLKPVTSTMDPGIGYLVKAEYPCTVE